MSKNGNNLCRARVPKAGGGGRGGLCGREGRGECGGASIVIPVGHGPRGCRGGSRVAGGVARGLKVRVPGISPRGR